MELLSKSSTIVQDILVTKPSYKFDSQDLNMPLKDDYVLVKTTT